MRRASWQAALVEGDGNDRYWPNGFFSELLAMFETDADQECRSTKLVEMYRRAAEELAADAIAEPRRTHSDKAGQQAAFEARLEARWGRGLDLADLVVNEAFESGRWANDLMRSEASASQDDKFEALIRLHGKAVMTAREVMVLLRSGYSTGAFARWRTLHEVWVVLLLLVDGDQELSRRYLSHEVVESLKGQEEYEETWEALGEEPPDWTADERNDTRAELADEFGFAFLHDYGWAAPLFGGKAPKFKHLQEHVELDHWRAYYRLASQGTHANPKGITSNIQSLADVNIVWAGPSNAGLVDPAQCSLIALAGVTAELMVYVVSELPDSADDKIFDKNLALVRQQQILLLMGHAIEELVEVHAQQEAEAEAMADLVSQTTAVLQGGSARTADELSAELGVDLEALEDALDSAAERGELLQEMHYRMEVDGSSEGEPDPGE